MITLDKLTLEQRDKLKKGTVLTLVKDAPGFGFAGEQHRLYCFELTMGGWMVVVKREKRSEPDWLYLHEFALNIFDAAGVACKES